MVKIQIEGNYQEVNKTIDHLKKYMAIYSKSKTYSEGDSEQIKVYLEVNPNAEELYVYPFDGGLAGGSHYSQDVTLASLSDVKRHWGFTNMEGTILHLKEGCYIVQNEKAKNFKVSSLMEKESN